MRFPLFCLRCLARWLLQPASCRQGVEPPLVPDLCYPKVLQAKSGVLFNRQFLIEHDSNVFRQFKEVAMIFLTCAPANTQSHFVQNGFKFAAKSRQFRLYPPMSVAPQIFVARLSAIGARRNRAEPRGTGTGASLNAHHGTGTWNPCTG